MCILKILKYYNYMKSHIPGWNIICFPHKIEWLISTIHNFLEKNYKKNCPRILWMEMRFCLLFSASLVITWDPSESRQNSEFTVMIQNSPEHVSNISDTSSIPCSPHLNKIIEQCFMKSIRRLLDTTGGSEWYGIHLLLWCWFWQQIKFWPPQLGATRYLSLSPSTFCSH